MKMKSAGLIVLVLQNAIIAMKMMKNALWTVLVMLKHVRIAMMTMKYE